MYRAQPKASKLLSAKWQEKEHQIHLKKLQTIKSAIKVDKPQSFQHLRTKPKKTQMLEERYTEIERENRILLEKMTNILQNPKGISHANAHLSQMNMMNPNNPQASQGMASMGMTGVPSAGVLPFKKSLNREARKRELMKITRENQVILKRLQEKKPNYNVTKWAQEDNNRRKLLENICEYPYLMNQQQEGDNAQDAYLSGPPDFIIKKKNRTANVNQPFFKKRGYTSDSGNGFRPSATHGGSQQIVKKETVYVGEHDLGNGLYQVEILYTINDDLVISAQRLEGPESFIIEIEKSKVGGLLQEFEGDFGFLAQFLRLQEKRMVLINPKFQNGPQNPDEQQPTEGDDQNDGGQDQNQQQDDGQDQQHDDGQDQDQEDGDQVQNIEEVTSDQAQPNEQIVDTALAQPVGGAIGTDQPLDTGIALSDTADGVQVQAQPMVAVAVDDEPAAATQVNTAQEGQNEASAADQASNDLGRPAEDRDEDPAAENVEQKQVEQDNQTQD